MIEREAFSQKVDVSRETLARLDRLEALLHKWNAAINLVSPSTLVQVWSRHFLDSAQLFDIPPEGVRHWVDLGSGGGFPGLVIAALALERRPGMRVTLVESDKRKSAFLIAAIRELRLSATVCAQRIEAVEPLEADVLSARALAPLPLLLNFAERHVASEGLALFPKGGRWRDELALAQQAWSFQSETLPSLTDAEAVVLKIKRLTRV